MVTFGPLVLPKVHAIDTTKERREIERYVPQRTVAYRIDQTALGQTIVVRGEIREAAIDDVLMRIEQLRRFNDGVARTFNVEDGATPVINAKLANPEYTIAVGLWPMRVPYSVSFLEVE